MDQSNGDPGHVPRARGGVRISNVTLTREDRRDTIGFDVAWSGLWRNTGTKQGGNWDAVWLFVKHFHPGGDHD